LINGQHRLQAIIDSGITTDFMVAYGFSPESISAMDLGGKRNSSMQASIALGEHVSNNDLAVCSVLLNAKDKSSRGFTINEKLSIYKKNKEYFNVLTKTSEQFVSVAGVKAAIVLFMADGGDKEVAAKFYSSVISGYVSNESESAAITLRNHLKKMGAEYSRGSSGIKRALKFQKRFAPLIESGEKRQTIRKKYKVKRGDVLCFFAIDNNEECTPILRDSHIVCTSVDDIVIDAFGIVLDGIECDSISVETLAHDDGFSSFSEMEAWFDAQYGLPFEGELIYWLVEDVL